MNTIFKIRFLLLILFVFNYPTGLNAQNTSEEFVVVLDAGHGGHDPGNLGNGYKEKDIALNIVLEVGKELEKRPDFKVIYTRKTDVFIDLFVRGRIANKANADLFVSVHCNSFHNNAHGTETFVLGLHANERNFNVAKKENEVIFLEEDYEKNYEGFDPSSPESYIGLTLMQEEYLDQSIQLADLIEQNFKGKLKRKSRGVKQAGFIVLHQTAMPSVLVETGFLTYKPEGSYLNSKTGQSQMAVAIREAILAYKIGLDQNVGLELPTTSQDVDFVETVSEEQIYKGIIFKVQIAASSRKLATKPYNFNGLQDISREKHDALYKYFYGNTSDYNLVKQLQHDAKVKGYSSCFIVAYKNDVPVSLNEVLKTTAN